MEVPDLILGSWKVDGFKLATFEKNNLMTVHGVVEYQATYSIGYDDDFKMWKLTAFNIGLINALIKEIDGDKMIIENPLKQNDNLEVDSAGTLLSSFDTIVFTKTL